MVLKKRLATILNDMIEPIRAKRKELEKDPAGVMHVLKQGTLKAAEVARADYE